LESVYVGSFGAKPPVVTPKKAPRENSFLTVVPRKSPHHDSGGSQIYQLNHCNVLRIALIDMNCSSYPVSVFVVIEFQNLICFKQRLLLYFYFATRIPSYVYATSLTFHFFAVRQMA
jgi:hypothetical protein